MMTRHIGIYPGTFDPLHAGHIAFAAAALRDCRLDEVVFLPEPSPRGKRHATSIDGRQTALEEALAGVLGTRVVGLASRRFTVAETLPELQQLFGPARLTILIGSDVARNLAVWPDLAMLLRDASLAIGLRDMDSPAQIRDTMERVCKQYGVRAEYTMIETQYPHVASSRIRRRLADDAAAAAG